MDCFRVITTAKRVLMSSRLLTHKHSWKAKLDSNPRKPYKIWFLRNRWLRRLAGIEVKVMDSIIGRTIDRISALPDSVLSHILTFLPTKYAVGTSILSRRWEHVWASVPHLELSDMDYIDMSRVNGYTSTDGNHSFMNFVDRVLLLSDVQCFESFRLLCFSVNDSQRVGTWICALIKRNVKMMELRLLVNQYFRLPPMLFLSKSLVVLILEAAAILCIPDSVWLPNLKVLHMDMICICEKANSIAKLISSCPVLEEFYIKRDSFDNFELMWDISVPTLKYLKIQCSVDVLEESNAESDELHKLVLKAPKLELLHLNDFLSQEISSENLSSLLEARINVDGDITKLIIGITNAKFLFIADTTLFNLTIVNDFKLPTFKNLIRLEIEANGDPGWNFLMRFLECSPNLEYLILQKGQKRFDFDEYWRPPQQVPICLSFVLKEIKIIEFTGKQYELEAIEYLLINATVLNKMTINCQFSKMQTFMKLAVLPKGSQKCLVDLQF